MEMPNNSETNITTTISILPPQQLSNGSHRKPSSSRVTSKEDIKIYVQRSTEWRVDERIRTSGKHEGRTDTFYYNYALKKQFRSLEEVARYIETGETPKCKTKRTETKQNASTEVKGSTSEAAKADSVGEVKKRTFIVERTEDYVVVHRKAKNFKKMKERARCAGVADLTRDLPELSVGPEFPKGESKSPLDNGVSDLTRDFLDISVFPEDESKSPLGDGVSDLTRDLLDMSVFPEDGVLEFGGFYGIPDYSAQYFPPSPQHNSTTNATATATFDVAGDDDYLQHSSLWNF